MNKSIEDNLEAYQIIEKQVLECEDILKALKSQKLNLENDIVNHFSETWTEKIEYKSYFVTAKFKPIISIQGGKFNNDKRIEVLNILAKIGYSNKIEQVPVIHEKDLTKIFAALPEEVMLNLIDKKLISVFNKPVIKIKEKD